MQYSEQDQKPEIRSVSRSHQLGHETRFIAGQIPRSVYSIDGKFATSERSNIFFREPTRKWTAVKISISSSKSVSVWHLLLPSPRPLRLFRATVTARSSSTKKASKKCDSSASQPITKRALKPQISGLNHRGTSPALLLFS